MLYRDDKTITLTNLTLTIYFRNATDKVNVIICLELIREHEFANFHIYVRDVLLNFTETKLDRIDLMFNVFCGLIGAVIDMEKHRYS